GPNLPHATQHEKQKPRGKSAIHRWAMGSASAYEAGALPTKLGSSTARTFRARIAHVNPRYDVSVMLARLGLAPGAAWLGYAWGAHLATPLCVHRAPRAAGRRIALTFDDGPDPEWTPRVVDALAEWRVRGTFFLVGERATRAPEAVRAIVAGGHEVASHGW